MFEEVRLYFTAPSSACESFWPSALPMLLAKCTRSIWSMAVLRANSRVLLRAWETWLYSLSAIMPLIDSEKALKAGGTV